MWWTPDGERILQGAAGRLFREALGMIVDMVRDDNEGLWQFAARPFDNLQPNQELTVVAQVGTALLPKDQLMPRLTAALEAAVPASNELIAYLPHRNQAFAAACHATMPKARSTTNRQFQNRASIGGSRKKMASAIRK